MDIIQNIVILGVGAFFGFMIGLVVGIEIVENWFLSEAEKSSLIHKINEADKTSFK